MSVLCSATGKAIYSRYRMQWPMMAGKRRDSRDIRTMVFRPIRGTRVEVTRTRLLVMVAALVVALNVGMLWATSHNKSVGSPAYLTTFLRGLMGDGDSGKKVDAMVALESWTEAVSTFVEVGRRKVGEGERTGGIVIAGHEQEICGTLFRGNSLRSLLPFPGVAFVANAVMVGSGNGACKKELEKAAKAGWHQGQMFFYRLAVDRPGQYTVRLTIVFFHNDKRRGDGITLALEDLIEVRLQCALSKGRFVVEPREPVDKIEESIGVVEFDTVAFGGEILMELEGIYTCVGLSLVETFFHPQQEQEEPLTTVSDAAKNTAVTHDTGAVAPVPDTRQSAAQLAPLEVAWAKAEGVCSEKYTREANLRMTLQRESISAQTTQDQRYFNEWARRERLEDSSGRYCRPHKAPVFGEHGWTWAGHSVRIIEEKAALLARVKDAKRAQSLNKSMFKAAVDAGVDAGVSRGTATTLAAEAVDKAIKAAGGKAVTLDGAREAKDEVARAAKALLKARGVVSPQDQERLQPPLDKVRRTVSVMNSEVDASELDPPPVPVSQFYPGGAGTRQSVRPPAEHPSTNGGSFAYILRVPEGRRRLADVSAAQQIWDNDEHEHHSVGDESWDAERPHPPPREPGVVRRFGGRGEEGLGNGLREGGGGLQEPVGGGKAGESERDSAEVAEKDEVAEEDEDESDDDEARVQEADETKQKDDARRWRVDPVDPIPPPVCPPRLVDLLDEALRVAADSSMKITASGSTAVDGSGAQRAVSWTGGGAGQLWSQQEGLPTWLGSSGSREKHRRRSLARQALDAGFQAVAAYRAHEVEWPEDGKGEFGGEKYGKGSKAGTPLPVWFNGFTWDGNIVVAKEAVPGCARVAQPVTPRAAATAAGWDEYSSGGWGVFAEPSYGSSSVPVDVGVGPVSGQGRKPCLKVEAVAVPTVETVVDIIVPVSAGLVPRLLVLMPQMEKLAKGASCKPLPDSHPLAPQCGYADFYAPAFWPDRLSRKGQQQQDGTGASFAGGRGGRNATTHWLRGSGGDDGGGGGRGSNFRVVVATDDPRVEQLVKEYNVETVFVLTRAPFSKATAIQDAAAFIPDDHILFVHDADLSPPCTLPDALRQTVVRGVQAVNLLLPYENSPIAGRCIYPLSTFGPMAMYASDFRAVGGIEDANKGRWGYEDTAFLRKVMLGENSLGVLRVHLPGLVHKWHEITPWKCLVWTWGGSASSNKCRDGCDMGAMDEPPVLSVAEALGA